MKSKLENYNLKGLQYCIPNTEISIIGWILVKSQFITGKYSEALKMWCTDLLSALLTFLEDTTLCKNSKEYSMWGRKRSTYSRTKAFKNLTVGSVPFQGLY